MHANVRRACRIVTAQLRHIVHSYSHSRYKGTLPRYHLGGRVSARPSLGSHFYVAIDEQHVALPKLYGAPAYARPPRPAAVADRPFDPDDLPIR